MACTVDETGSALGTLLLCASSTRGTMALARCLINLELIHLAIHKGKLLIDKVQFINEITSNVLKKERNLFYPFSTG